MFTDLQQSYLYKFVTMIGLLFILIYLFYIKLIITIYLFGRCPFSLKLLQNVVSAAIPDLPSSGYHPW